jgi:cytochrome c-type biogenesis protein
MEKLKDWLSTKGYLGALLLGMLFALAFCPYSGVLFFGVLTPLILSSSEGILLAPFFSLGTGLPVIVFSSIIAFSIQKMSQAFAIVSKVEKVIRIVVASTFILVGLYYLQFLVKYIWILMI